MMQIELLIMKPPAVNLCVHEVSKICRVCCASSNGCKGGPDDAEIERFESLSECLEPLSSNSAIDVLEDVPYDARWSMCSLLVQML